MGRKKKHFNIMDENATKSRDIHFRITPRELIELERVMYKRGISKSEIYRQCFKKCLNELLSDE
jgi:hypothetical protein